jgi:hypothetical protein
MPLDPLSQSTKRAGAGLPTSRQLPGRVARPQPVLPPRPSRTRDLAPCPHSTLCWTTVEQRATSSGDQVHSTHTSGFAINRVPRR